MCFPSDIDIPSKSVKPSTPESAARSGAKSALSADLDMALLTDGGSRARGGSRTKTHGGGSEANGKRTPKSDGGGDERGGSPSCLAAGGGAPGGYGGRRVGGAGRAGNARGSLAQTRSGFRVGARVRNVSGRGVWGFGTIATVIPANVSPRWFCRRYRLPLVFGKRCATLTCTRYIVLGDDGRYHTPRKVEVA